MTRPSIDEIRGLGDFQSVFRWNLLVPTAPKAVSGFPTGPELNLRCESVTIPKRTLTQSDVALRGHSIKNSGIMKYDQKITLVFVEDVAATLRKATLAWKEAIWKSKTGAAGAAREDLQGVFLLHQLDQEDDEVWEYKLVGCLLEDSDHTNLDSTTTDAQKVTWTISYDYFEEKEL